jgi:putative oxidoreductase
VAAVPIASTNLVAGLTAHAGKGPWNHNGGWEYVLVLSTIAIGLAFNGAGKWSLDNAIGWDVSGLWWGNRCGSRGTNCAAQWAKSAGRQA